MKIKTTTFLPEVRTGARGARFHYPPQVHDVPGESFFEIIRDLMKRCGYRYLAHTDTRALLEYGYGRSRYVYYLHVVSQ